MDFAPAGNGRLFLSLAVLVVLALLAWLTMEPGKFQKLTWVSLGFCAVRIVLGWLRSRKMNVGPVEEQDRADM